MAKARPTIPLSFTLLSAALALGTTAGLVGCGNGATGGTGGSGSGGSTGASTCFDYTDYKGDTPATTFKTDVLPIFRTSCGLSDSCHGNQSGTGAQHYYGPKNSDPAPTDAMIKAIFDQAVGVMAVENPDQMVIAAGDPAHSFMTFKLDGVGCTKLTCNQDMTCGTSMPQSGGLLDSTKRETIRRWIQQGAKND